MIVTGVLQVALDLQSRCQSGNSLGFDTNAVHNEWVVGRHGVDGQGWGGQSLHRRRREGNWSAPPRILPSCGTCRGVGRAGERPWRVIVQCVVADTFRGVGGRSGRGQ